ncbi:hypothetical protein ANCDUO_20904 [Ancylostoma duodenale]|uniref:Uncharacterized protein n=1 Tax=Ancylostoma duodenale TaxID=51022 RepID=A0A0C2CGV7_9BILA|nr:hypothetical protein ANCDUO_20904 [Ancylostoma duodenale]
MRLPSPETPPRRPLMRVMRGRIAGGWAAAVVAAAGTDSGIRESRARDSPTTGGGRRGVVGLQRRREIPRLLASPPGQHRGRDSSGEP